MSWTPEEAALVECYGVCTECGAPRAILDTTLPGSQTRYMKMVCIADESHADPMQGFNFG